MAAASPPRYTFTGPVTTGFFAYTDLDTGQMLVAEPGKSYAMKCVEADRPVPPNDLQWELVKATKGGRGSTESSQGGES